jgi:hypothetical protein
MTKVSDNSLPKASPQTGPRTREGKSRSSANAMQHGLLSRKLLLDGESQEEFQTLFDTLIADHRPSGLLETTLVEKIAICIWRQQRLVAAETARIALRQSPQQGEVRSLIRHALGASHSETESLVDQAMHQSSRTGSAADTELSVFMQLAQLAVTVPVADDPLSRYQTALDNELYKALRALREAQSWRLNHLESSVDG